MQSSSSNGNRYVRRSAAEWRDLLQRFSRGGQSRAAFCASEGVAPSTFDLWYRKLHPTKPTPRKKPSEFVELIPSPAPVSGWSIEIELPDGTVARLRS